MFLLFNILLVQISTSGLHTCFRVALWTRKVCFHRNKQTNNKGKNFFWTLQIIRILLQSWCWQFIFETSAHCSWQIIFNPSWLQKSDGLGIFKSINFLHWFSIGFKLKDWLGQARPFWVTLAICGCCSVHDAPTVYFNVGLVFLRLYTLQYLSFSKHDEMNYLLNRSIFVMSQQSILFLNSSNWIKNVIDTHLCFAWVAGTETV